MNYYYVTNHNTIHAHCTTAHIQETLFAQMELYQYIIYHRFIVLFSDRVGLPLHNIPCSGLLMKSIGAEFL